MSVHPQLIELILHEFQMVLTKNLDDPWEQRHGPPPKYGYIEHTHFVEEDSNRRGEAIAAWHISRTSIKTTLVRQTSKPSVNGIFFNLFYGDFCFIPDGSAVYINWQTGPKFGRGMRHRVGVDTLGEYLLSVGQSTWVS
jgi:hypothetical protein